jgi:hypothetical protein
MNTQTSSPEFDPTVTEWDSESRLSGYCTVWSPEQDDEDEWQRNYDKAMTMWGQEDLATEYADAHA